MTGNRYVGVVGPRELEKSVRQALANGKLASGAPLAIEADIASPAFGLAMTVAGTLDTGRAARRQLERK